MAAASATGRLGFFLGNRSSDDPFVTFAPPPVGWFRLLAGVGGTGARVWTENAAERAVVAATAAGSRFAASDITGRARAKVQLSSVTRHRRTSTSRVPAHSSHQARFRTYVIRTVPRISVRQKRSRALPLSRTPYHSDGDPVSARQPSGSGRPAILGKRSRTTVKSGYTGVA